jgi:hypothetical protein
MGCEMSWRSGRRVLRAVAARVGVGDRITRKYAIRRIIALRGGFAKYFSDEVSRDLPADKIAARAAILSIATMA